VIPLLARERAAHVPRRGLRCLGSDEIHIAHRACPQRRVLDELEDVPEQLVENRLDRLPSCCSAATPSIVSVMVRLLSISDQPVPSSADSPHLLRRSSAAANRLALCRSGGCQDAAMASNG
jgi:hypothetical protein